MSDGGRSGGAWTTAGVVIALCLLSTFTAHLPKSRTVIAGDIPSGTQPNSIDPSSSGTALPVPGATQTIGGKVVVGGRTYDCARGQNAGGTEEGVTATEIRFAATVVKTGIAKDFLSDAQWGMEAVRRKVNRAGGICGRRIRIDYENDGWEPSRGQRIIEGWIQSKRYFGLAVNPSSEGVRGAIDSHVIRDNRFPVIGSDGQLIDQYQDPWVWPVATSTSSVMHIMARNAYERGARTFGIVWDQNYRFGVEGHLAFVNAVRRLGGRTTSDVGVQGGQQSYSNQVNTFIDRCGGIDLSDCDFLALLLEPATATRWVGDGGLGNGTDRPRVGIGAPQPLFVNSFARDCGRFCDNMWVWTSFKPPIPPFDTEPAVATYLNDLDNVNRQADENNPHVQGAYLGMQLLVEAFRRAGPAPTRAGIKAILDGMTLSTGIAPAIRFTPDNHFANVQAQAFYVLVNNGSFYGWRHVQGFVTDTDVGRDIPRS